MRVASARPLDKVTYGAVAAAVVAVVVWLLETYAGVAVPQPVRDALIVLAYAAVAYLVPLRPDEVVPE